MKSVLKEHIGFLPSAIHGKKAVIAGTRIRVEDVYIWHELQGKSPRQLVEEFPHLTLADVHAAMAYYWDNEELIQQQMRRGEEVEAEMRKKYPPKLPEAMKKRGMDVDSVSP